MSDVLKFVPVILCGGSGARLWPLSRTAYPKQFLSLGIEQSLFQQTVARIQAVNCGQYQADSSYIVTLDEHHSLAQQQWCSMMRAKEISLPTWLLEPSARNTAAALTLAALQAQHTLGDSILLACPADAYIGQPEVFVQQLRCGITQAQHGGIVVFGVTPTSPETGYGYLHFSPESEQGISAVKAFVEKPHAELAAQYVAAKTYAWNSGIFVLKASLWIKALAAFRPDILSACDAAWAKRSENFSALTGARIRPHAELYAAVPKESIDYAVMEKCPGSAYAIDMLPLDAQWSDVGTWAAVDQVSPRDAQGNVSQGDVMLIDSHDTYAHSSKRLVAALGVQDLVIVETADAVFVSHKDSPQATKKIVDELARLERVEHLKHRKTHFDWGWTDCLVEGETYQVNHLGLKPSAQMVSDTNSTVSRQLILLEGKAKVTTLGTERYLRAGESIQLICDQTLKLDNPGEDELIFVETIVRRNRLASSI